ncbi:MAG: hypothetical protein HY343_12435, partial [Lentisphaerae bacterium]|nr:hypothetical protein [Lentisphaerota bacterium]
ESLLDTLTNAGLTNAVLLLSLNNKDHNGQFPNSAWPDTNGWLAAARSRGFMPGFYDIYRGAHTNGTPSAPYQGTYYLWPTNLLLDWAYRDRNGQPVIGGAATNQYEISAQLQVSFCRDTRLPAHLGRFGMDAYFFDTTLAAALYEDYSTNGHFASRAMDLANRFALLESGYSNSVKRLIVGSEQGRSWGVPVAHWVEGKFWLGQASAVPQTYGAWNDNAYPALIVDVADPTSISNTTLGLLLSDGCQAPLWDLVFHDCIVSTVHWGRSHNKYLYAWDHNDLWAMLRGQAPHLNMVEAGVQGSAGRIPNTLTNAFDEVWSTRWTVMSNRYIQTFTSVCPWQAKVMYMEMTDHQWLKPDRSVQLTEFSGDGGWSGHGIVVNFGLYDGAYGVTNETWTGTVRNAALSVPVKGYRTYSWDTTRPALGITASSSNAGAMVIRFSGEPGSAYGVEMASNLVSAEWLRMTTLVSGIVGTNLTYEYTDPDSAGLSQRFYRVVFSNAQVTQLYSGNAVGFFWTSIPPTGGFSFVAVNFTGSGTSNLTLLDLFGTNQLTKDNVYVRADKVYVWNTAGQVFERFAQRPSGEFFNEEAWDGGSATNPVLPSGRGVWLQSPQAATTAHPIYLMGAVVALGAVSNAIRPGYQCLGSPFSADLVLTNNDWLADGAIGNDNKDLADQLIVWSGSAFERFGLASNGKWYAWTNWVTQGGTPADRRVTLGQGAWYFSVSGTNWIWTQPKPYSWP